jgi:hypothetical protein
LAVTFILRAGGHCARRRAGPGGIRGSVATAGGRAARFPGARLVAITPDTHYGYGVPVGDWKIPWGGPGRPERGLEQLGSLGGGNHFIELQSAEQTGTLFVQVHTGSRGFGLGLATHYFAMAKEERPGEVEDIDLGYFTPDSRHYRSYLNAVAAGGNYAILNRLILDSEVPLDESSACYKSCAERLHSAFGARGAGGRTALKSCGIPARALDVDVETDRLDSDRP